MLVAGCRMAGVRWLKLLAAAPVFLVLVVVLSVADII
jgi:hypothetical protein